MTYFFVVRNNIELLYVQLLALIDVYLRSGVHAHSIYTVLPLFN